MNKTTLLTVAVIGLLLLNAGMLVFMFTKKPHDGPPLHEQGREGAAGFIIEQLKLDDKQQLQFAELRKQHQQETREAQEENHRLHDEYFELLKQDNADKNKVDSLASLIGMQHKKLELAMFNHFQQVRSICHDEQKKLFDATIDEILHHMIAPPFGDRGGPAPR